MSRPKPNFWPGIASSSADVVDDLQEAADRRAALVQLAGRVQVARPEAEGDDAVGLRAQPLDERLQALLLGRVDERLDRDVVARAAPARAAPRPSPPARHGTVRRTASTLVRPVLRLLDVRLVERVDLEDRARDGGRELPAEELGAEVVRVGELHLARLAVGAVGRLVRRGDEPAALLAGRFGEQLLDPQTESVGVRLRDDLVAALLPGRAEREPEREAGVVVGDAAGVQRLLGAVEQPARGRRPSARPGRARTARAPSSGRRSSARRRRRARRAPAPAARAASPDR